MNRKVRRDIYRGWPPLFSGDQRGPRKPCVSDTLRARSV